MHKYKFIFCEHCKNVFLIDADKTFDECPLCDKNGNLPAIPESVSDELARRDKIIARLKEDAERLAQKWIDEYEGTTTCRFCGKENMFDWETESHFCDHAPDCPITLHRALMKELE